MESKELTSKKCTPCRGGIPPIERAKAEELVKSTDGWNLSEDATRISRQFQFKDFKLAIDFVNQVANLAEEEGHHPDFEIHYNKVKLVVYTHKIKGLHENDFIMAAKINLLTKM